MLLDGTMGTKVALPVPAGSAYGEWRAVGEESAYEGGPMCVALYDIATRKLSYRSGSKIPDLDRVGAPEVCRALRRKVAADYARLPAGEFAYRDGLLAERGDTPDKRVRLAGCRGHSRIIQTGREPRDLYLADGLLTWDDAHAGTAIYGEAGNPDEEGLRHGILSSYSIATGKHHDVSLPSATTIVNGADKVSGVRGYSTHAGRDLFWIAARTVGGSPTLGVETSAVYATKW